MSDFANHRENLPYQCPYCGFAHRFPPLGGVGCVACTHCGGVGWFGRDGVIEPLSAPLGKALAKFDLTNSLHIAEIALIPESVARENRLLMLARTTDGLILAAVPPVDEETIEKLQFILNRRVWIVPVSGDWLEAHIEQVYRQSEAERYLLLMLEDNAERIERFKQTLKSFAPQLELRYWRSGHAMIEEVQPYLELAALISLDHDLEPFPGELDPGDGVAVAKYPVSQPLKRPVIIHSSNSERARWMAGDFELSGRPYWRVVPYADDWIETHWKQVVEEILRLPK